MSISMFDILGPITVGPSSSHTAGAVRLGLACRTILGEEVKKAKITFYGSFADTYRGHGTDKAVIGGLLGFNTDNVKIRESLQLAQFRGMQYEFFTGEESRYHPNTLAIEASGKNTTIGVVATNVKLTKAQATKVAGMAHDGLARCIRPIHTSLDGDTIFCLSTGELEFPENPVDPVGILAAKVAEQAIIRAVKAAK